MEAGLLCLGTWAVTEISLCDQGFNLFLMAYKQARRFLCFGFKSDTETKMSYKANFGYNKRYN